MGSTVRNEPRTAGFPRGESGSDVGRRPPAEQRAVRVLIVDDEVPACKLLAVILGPPAFRCSTAHDGIEALEVLRSESFDAVICDLKMPYVDGPGLYRALVRRENPMQHRVLFVMGDTMGPRTLEFLKSSGLPYLAKPFLVEELKEAVRRALAAVPASEEMAAGAERSRASDREP